MFVLQLSTFDAFQSGERKTRKSSILLSLGFVDDTANQELAKVENIVEQTSCGI